MGRRTVRATPRPRRLVGKAVDRLDASPHRLLCGSLVVAGTVVTGAGPHAGDSSKVHAVPVDWKTARPVHAELAWLVVTLTLALWLVLRAFEALPGRLPAAHRELMLVLLRPGG